MKKFTQFKTKRSKETSIDDTLKINVSPNREGRRIIEDPKPKDQIGTPKKFFTKILESREMAQVYHWTVDGSVGSYAAHLALQSYYEGIIGLLDDLVEVYQGQYDLIEEYDIIDTSTTRSKDKIEYFSDLAQFIKGERTICLSEEDTHMQNIVDEILALIYKTLYKLRFNR